MAKIFIILIFLTNVINAKSPNNTQLVKQKSSIAAATDPLTEVPITTTVKNSAPNNPCALWTRYNNDEAPLVNGVSAGISYFSNTTVYVGMGMYKDQRMPARIQITSSSKGPNPRTPGGYISSASEILVPFVEYLAIPDGCLCSWLSPSIASNRSLIFTGDPKTRLIVGRKTFEDGRIGLTKVSTFETLETINWKQCYNPTITSESCTEPSTEILVCATNLSTVGRPKIIFPTESCGMWSTIGMLESAAINGLAVGLSIANNTAFVGRGQKGDLFLPGRYQDKDVIGTYVAYNGKEQMVDYGSQWLIVPQNCTCSWMTPDQGKIRNGLVTVPDQTHNYMIGRKLLSKGLVSIMYVINVYNLTSATTRGWYANSAKSEENEFATEVLVCETLPAPLPACSLWTRYNNDDAPSVNGFSAGISIISNTTAYIGMGMYKDQRIPARIQITTSVEGSDPKTPGGYIIWYTDIQVPYVDYLVVPDGCTCLWLAPSIASNHHGLILVGEPTYGLAIGRKTFEDGRVALSKVPTFAKSEFYMNQWYNPTSDTDVANETATELLVCETNSSTSGRPKINFNTESCGTWSTIGMQFSATNAFDAGLSIINNTAYVGRGQKSEQFTIGRYQVESPAGTYVAFGGKEQLVDYRSQWLIVPQNCSCKWMHSDQAKIRKGLVSTPDQHMNLIVGRKTFSNGLVSIMHVNNVYELDQNVTWGWYAKLDKTEAAEYAKEILVCETLPPPLNACALWTRYNNDSAPSINGLSVGISVKSNATIYVGMGMISDRRLPARIQIANSTVGNFTWTPGGYVSHGEEVQVDFAEYLVIPDGCTCSWVAPSIASNRAIIFTGDSFKGIAIGRKVFENGRVSLTKVYTFAKYGNYMNQCSNSNPTNRKCGEPATELLVCETNLSTSERPKINFPTESCGMWSTIGMKNSASKNGFSAGNSYSKSVTAYIGRGQKENQYIPGRYQVDAPTGTYVTFNGSEQLVDYGSQWLIVPQNCSCSFMTPDQAKIRKGLVTVPDQTHNYMIGRKIFINGKVAITSVNNAKNNEQITIQWYVNTDRNEAKDYATEVLVCETLPPPLNSCALWTKYNNDDAPSINGFSAGISIISNTTAYVGMGMYGNWRQPARIQINGTIGAFTIWSKEVKVNYAEYLVVPDSCSCSWLPPSIASNRAIILTGDPGVGFAVGRKTFSDGRVAISKVITFARNSDYMLQWYNPTSDTEVTNERTTELLVCETNSSTTERPKINFPTESCGMWSTIGIINSAATNGFAVGLSIANITAYVGRGQKSNRFIPGRYQPEIITGTYVTFNNTEQMVDYGSQFLIVPQNCSCRWMNPEAAKDHKGLITIPDSLFNFMIGRMNFSNGIVSISRVNFKNSDEHLYKQWYLDLNKTEYQEVSDIASEVLICKKS